VIGTFSPTVENHIVDLPIEKTPKGMFARGKYKGKAMVN
jgi:hypothetical protein